MHSNASCKPHPDWSGLVTYLQITPKSRSAIAEYSDMERQLGAAAGRINATFGEASWTPDPLRQPDL